MSSHESRQHRFLRPPGRLGFLLLALTWAVTTITTFSTDRFSAGHTAGYIETVLARLLPTVSSATIHLIHIGIRKLAHVSEYGFFALLVFGICAGGQTRWQRRWFLYTLAGVMMLAMLDEYHQSFFSSRGASFSDCLIDLAGGAIVCAIIWLSQRRRFTER